MRTLVVLGILTDAVNGACRQGEQGCLDNGECDVGYRLDMIYEVKCININECHTVNCEHECVDTEGSYECRCNDGYILAADGTSCDDIDECSLGGTECENCKNLDGSYECYCEKGYELKRDGLSCRNINECYDNPCGELAKCSDTEGSFKCECYEGYIEKYFPNGEFNRCEDINECVLGTHKCQFYHGENLNPSENLYPVCINEPGMYSCECPEFYLSRFYSCVYIQPEVETTEPFTEPVTEQAEPTTKSLTENPLAFITDSTESSGVKDDQNNDHIYIIVFVGLGIVIIVIIVAVIIFCGQHKSKSRRSKSAKTFNNLLNADDLDSPEDENEMKKMPTSLHYQDSFDDLSSDGSIQDIQPVLSKFTSLSNRNETYVTDYATFPAPPSTMIDPRPRFIVGEEDMSGTVIKNPNYPHVVPLFKPDNES